MRRDPVVEKYLARYAEPEARLAELDGLREHGPWTYALTIPARRETIACLGAGAAPSERDSVLTVLVVNASEAAADREAGALLMEAIEAMAPARWSAPGLSLHPLAAGDLLLVDRCSGARAFGPRDGVGLARKLGADLITWLIAAGRIRSAWIHTTDADATLPAEHFERVASLERGAAVAPFRHVAGGDLAIDEATLRYEASLHYYVEGLRRAGSPYAFHTIGSLISVACSSYAQVRGFPRRQAGEDFYMLNKLAKLGPIHRLEGAPVEIRARRSTRAPFGTGPAVEAQLAGQPLRVYDPRVFGVLGEALRGLELFAETGDSAALLELARAHAKVAELRSWADGARELANRYPQAQLRNRFTEHFDGFRTLKLIHALTEQWPKLGWDRVANGASATRARLGAGTAP